MPLTHKQWYYKGLKDGIPIGLGYFAVALAMGALRHETPDLRPSRPR